MHTGDTTRTTNPEDARRLTIKRNSVAVVTDGSAVERGAAVARDVESPDVVLLGTGRGKVKSRVKRRRKSGKLGRGKKENGQKKDGE